MEDLNVKLNTHFAGKVVRKDLTKKIKEGVERVKKIHQKEWLSRVIFIW